ncbi:hypothetical protein CBL_20360 [Carabus blaptoides fortunei]
MLSDLNREPSGKFFNFCRVQQTEYFLNEIGPRIGKKDTNIRKCFPVQERLTVALRFLATGDSYASLSYLFKCSPQTVSKCVDEDIVVLLGMVESMNILEMIVNENVGKKAEILEMFQSEAKDMMEPAVENIRQDLSYIVI